MTAPVKTWASLPANPTTDAALRRAAAEKVMGWFFTPTYNGNGAWVDGPTFRDAGRWLRNWNRDDLALVFAAARNETDTNVTRWVDALHAAWLKARDDPRAALCALLELLGIEPPAELCNNDGEREGRQSPATPNT